MDPLHLCVAPKDIIYVTCGCTHDVWWFIILITQHVQTLQFKPSACIRDRNIRYKLEVGGLEGKGLICRLPRESLSLQKAMIKHVIKCHQWVNSTFNHQQQQFITSPAVSTCAQHFTIGAISAIRHSYGHPLSFLSPPQSAGRSRGGRCVCVYHWDHI